VKADGRGGVLAAVSERDLEKSGTLTSAVSSDP